MKSFEIARPVESEALTGALDSVRGGLDEDVPFEPRIVLFTKSMSKRILQLDGWTVADVTNALAAHESPEMSVSLGGLRRMGGKDAGSEFCLGFPIVGSPESSQRHQKGVLLRERRVLAEIFGIRLREEEDTRVHIYVEALVLRGLKNRTRGRALKAWQDKGLEQQEVTLLGSQPVLGQKKLVTVC